MIPEIAGICSCEPVYIQTEVSQSQIEHKEGTRTSHLLHAEEGQDADAVEEESQQAWKSKQSQRFPFKPLLSSLD